MEQISITSATSNTTANNALDNEKLRPIRLENLCFAATCDSCGYYSPDGPDSGWCRKHRTWTSPSKWSCSEYV